MREIVAAALTGWPSKMRIIAHPPGHGSGGRGAGRPQRPGRAPNVDCAVPPGSFFYIPADVPHLAYDPSATDTVVAVIARTDPNEQESVVLLPSLDGAATRAPPQGDG